jgi:hypothetical protein
MGSSYWGNKDFYEKIMSIVICSKSLFLATIYSVIHLK